MNSAHHAWMEIAGGKNGSLFGMRIFNLKVKPQDQRKNNMVTPDNSMKGPLSDEECIADYLRSSISEAKKFALLRALYVIFIDGYDFLALSCKSAQGLFILFLFLCLLLTWKFIL